MGCRRRPAGTARVKNEPSPVLVETAPKTWDICSLVCIETRKKFYGRVSSAEGEGWGGGVLICFLPSSFGRWPSIPFEAERRSYS